jgi:integrase
MALTAAMVRGLRAPGKYLDGHGLVLHVVTVAKRYWVFRYVHDGRERSMSLGSAAVLTLADARALHTEARRKLMLGVDPLAERQQAQREAKAQRAATMSFSEAAARYIQAHRDGWRGRTEGHWRSSLAIHAGPVFGSKPVDTIDIDDVLAVLGPIWTTKNPLAVILRSRIELVLSFAKARGWRTGENPARWRDHLGAALPKPAKVHTVAHRAALDWRKAPALMAALEAAEGHRGGMASRALRFLMLTCARSSEVRLARWCEFDPANALWVIPGSRMKARAEHRVPLSDAALAILRPLASLRTGEGLVFLGHVRGRGIGDVTLTRALHGAGYTDVTVHGMRSTFRDWCADHGHPGDLAEIALAHTVGSAVERSYRRSDVLERRRKLMERWADFLTALPAEVIPLLAAIS